ncbi:DUF2586 domain-containing protein [Brevibacillus agri]|uniref:DUF2586 domain-containing protein n=1 Tax=Brevibacillus agri TaxID=51101 RepID=UPI0018CE7DC2|nr:DUF2586 domain-containing protein [Brevibacillus agri]MBG9567441.1 hypothetical protein [Brevibacillus agri]
MLRDVKTTVTDGGLGVGTVKGEGVHVKIGASPVASTSPILITGSMSDKKIKELLGVSPLADAVMDSVENGSSKIYCLPVQASIAGSLGTLTKGGTGTGNATVSGTPNNAYDIVVAVTGAGGFNQATLQYSIDGGNTFSSELTLPLSGALVIPDTGVTITFQESSQTPADSFKVGDLYKVKTTAPQLSNQDVLDALAKLRNAIFPFEFVHIVGETSRPLWLAVSTEVTTFFEKYKKPLFVVMEAKGKQENETLNDFYNRLAAERRGIDHTDVQIVASWSRYRKMDGRVVEVNNAGIVCGLYAKALVQQSIGETKSFSIPEAKISALLPEGIEDYIGALDDEKYLTFRQYEGLSGCYVTNARMMAPDGSDYRYAENVRVKNKIIRETRKEALKQLQSMVDMEDVQGSLEAIAKFIEIPLDEMVRAKEISSARIEVPEGQDILVTETLQVVIRFVPVGYVREIAIDLGMENPFRMG